MEACGLVFFERAGTEKLVRPPSLARLKSLRALRRSGGPVAARANPAGERVRASLAHYGAPLAVPGGRRAQPLNLEAALAAGLTLAHEDAAVAGNLPVVLWKNQSVDLREVSDHAVRAGEAQTLGFFLELTDELAGGQSFSAAAAPLRDKRLSRMKNFFTTDGHFRPYEEELAAANTPEVAKRWHFLMNMSLGSFQSYFRKGTQPSVNLATR
jgi:hypothetical protein